VFEVERVVGATVVLIVVVAVVVLHLPVSGSQEVPVLVIVVVVFDPRNGTGAIWLWLVAPEACSSEGPPKAKTPKRQTMSISTIVTPARLSVNPDERTASISLLKPLAGNLLL
jgi:hypothetical protein